MCVHFSFMTAPVSARLFFFFFMRDKRIRMIPYTQNNRKETIRRRGAKYSWQVLPQKNGFQSNCSITDTIAYSGFSCGMIFKWNYLSCFLHLEWGWRQVSNTQKCWLRFGLFQRDFWGLESQNFCRKRFYIWNTFTDSWNLQSSFLALNSSLADKIYDSYVVKYETQATRCQKK